VIEYLFEAVEIEAISYVFFIYSTEELMVFKIAKPVDPPIAFL
jgi:hypothetical protein